jgi:hypothetical protein
MKLKRITAPLKQKAKEAVKRIKEMPFESEPLLKKPGYIDLNRKLATQKAFAVLGGIKQKEFNSAARKLVKNNALIQDVAKSRSKSIAAGIVSGVNKAKASVLRGVEQTTGLPSLRGKVQKAENLSNPFNAAKKIGRKTKKAKRLIEKVDQNPGSLVREGVAKVAENPIAIGGTAAGWVPTVASGVVVPGTTEASAALELAAKKNPRYNKITKKLGEKVRSGRAGDIIEHGTNTVRRSMPLLLV